jgi:large subunit ribosomal protein L3
LIWLQEINPPLADEFIIMTKFILGRKLGMTTIYDQNLGALNVTLIECEPNLVSLIRSLEKDGYKAIQIGIAKSKVKSQKSKGKKFDKVKEFRTEAGELKAGDNLDISQFEVGDKVKVSGITKAKGFQGVMKRHGFKGSPHSHGHKHDWRAPGSIGAGFPEHVIKGKKMAGRMGGKRASTKNLKVVYIDKEKKLLGVKGAVPGVAGRIVEILAN